MDWFLYNSDLCHETVNPTWQQQVRHYSQNDRTNICKIKFAPEFLLKEHAYQGPKYTFRLLLRVKRWTTAQKMQYFIKDFFSKCDQICSLDFLRSKLIGDLKQNLNRLYHEIY